MLAWHFLTIDRTPGMDADMKIVPGETLKLNPEDIRLCGWGFHGSRLIIDALGYAPGPIIQRTRHGGRILRDRNKICSSERTCVWVVDASVALRRFALDVVKCALNLRGAPKSRPDISGATNLLRVWASGSCPKGRNVRNARSALYDLISNTWDQRESRILACVRYALDEDAKDAAWGAYAHTRSLWDDAPIRHFLWRRKADRMLIRRLMNAKGVVERGSA